ncbi:trk-like receptor tyrosine kinase [Elysia marginata]|uniref:Tyrosine-protein kinase receptor n=1 Tax=Elysia marginata TaxID=1093978 RepID=A0AAV4H282_9GAST|nr:trk-like receptor tyrosine kinase [Elysia marginata]
MLRQPTDSPQSTGQLPEVVIPVVSSCVVIIFLLTMFACLYRHRRKLIYFKGKRDSILRNNDGAILLENMNTITKNPTYYYQSATGVRKFNTKIVPAESIVLGQVVGEGAFGQVFKGEMTLPDYDAKTKVAVKILKEGASREAQEDFEREVEIMSSFDHDNILKLLGIVTQGAEGNPYMIFEFMEHGDLTELLRRNDPYNHHLAPPPGGAAPGQGHSMTLKKGQNARPRIMLSKADLVDISVQIANGMSYLATQHFVHRDLATRNCLVGAGLVVKISDFGMSRDIYTNDYYRIGGSRMLPVRWMSPEAIKYGRFTCESDIWAYGVVLWEIFSFGKQPYYGHSNEEVIHLLDQGILLQRPEDCPSTIYHVMIGCWKKDPRQRIIFERTTKYLRDYANHLMNNQRQQQQQQQQQQRQRQQHQRQQHQHQQHREKQQTQPQPTLEEEDSRKHDDVTSCSSSDRTDISDVSDTHDDSNVPRPAPAAITVPQVESTVSETPVPSRRDCRHEFSNRRMSTDTVHLAANHSPLLSSTSSRSDANVSSMLMKSIKSPRAFYHSHHHRSLTIPNNSKSSRSLFKTNGFSFQAPSSRKIFRALSSRKGRKAASYSALLTSVSRDITKGRDRYALATEGGRRYSSGETSGLGSLRNLFHRKLSDTLAINNPPCDKLNDEQLENRNSNASKTAVSDGITGTLLMDRLNAVNKKSLATQNAYDTSLLRDSSLKSTCATSATSNECQTKAMPKPSGYVGELLGDQLQAETTPVTLNGGTT